MDCQYWRSEKAPQCRCSGDLSGWRVVTRTGQFKTGDRAVYISIDAWVPHDIAPFLSKGEPPRKYNGIAGEKLKTIRLRGVVSQGLLLSLPLDLRCHKLECDENIIAAVDINETLAVGTSVDSQLGIQLWEAEIPAQLSGRVKGSFPSFIPKTNQERIQNIPDLIKEYASAGLTFEVSEKLDGASMTVFYNKTNVGVCSRNYELTETAESTLWQVALNLDLIQKLVDLDQDIALQGELIGPGIQGNPYNLKKAEFKIFDIFNIKENRYLGPEERFATLTALKIPLFYHVPLIADNFKIGPLTIVELIQRANGLSFCTEQRSSQEREGVVFKCDQRPEISFKIISNNWLLRH